MEFIPTIEISNKGYKPHSELSFKSDCTEIKRISYENQRSLFFGKRITNIQTYCPQDTSKEQNLIFPTKFIKFFKLLSSSEFGRRVWFDDCSRGNFNEAGIDTNYDADVGNICSGDSKVDFMRYIYRDMVVPFTKLEKENNHLREQLERKDQELKEKDRELEKTKGELNKKVQQHRSEKLKVYYDCVGEFQEEIEEKDRELNNTQEELYTTYQELKDTEQELKDTEQELKDTEQELKETQEQLKDTEQELKDTKKEVNTRGILLKSCVDDLKTCAEEIENVEKKNQELEHLNHRLICETSSSFIDRTSYFTSEM